MSFHHHCGSYFVEECTQDLKPHSLFHKIPNLIACCLVLVAYQPRHVYASKKVNLTRLLEEALLGPEYRETTRDEAPIILREVSSYLPENDYVEDYEVQLAEDTRQLNRLDRNLLPEYRSLCEIITRKVQLTDTEFEYQPPHYHEIFCKSYSIMFGQTQRNPVKPARQRCAHPGFHCVQRSKTMFMVRRRWDNECWEPFTKEVASGCDCMWPVSSLGEISAHY